MHTKVIDVCSFSPLHISFFLSFFLSCVSLYSPSFPVSWIIDTRHYLCICFLNTSFFLFGYYCWVPIFHTHLHFSHLSSNLSRSYLLLNHFRLTRFLITNAFFQKCLLLCFPPFSFKWENGISDTQKWIDRWPIFLGCFKPKGLSFVHIIVFVVKWMFQR